MKPNLRYLLIAQNYPVACAAGSVRAGNISRFSARTIFFEEVKP
jgi:hypothetical protein